VLSLIRCARVAVQGRGGMFQKMDAHFRRRRERHGGGRPLKLRAARRKDPGQVVVKKHGEQNTSPVPGTPLQKHEMPGSVRLAPAETPCHKRTKRLFRSIDPGAGHRTGGIGALILSRGSSHGWTGVLGVLRSSRLTLTCLTQKRTWEVEYFGARCRTKTQTAIGHGASTPRS